jgi:hypothetical protein
MAEQPEVACGVTGQQWGHDATRILWLSLWTINMVRRFESVFMIQTFILRLLWFRRPARSGRVILMLLEAKSISVWCPVSTLIDPRPLPVRPLEGWDDPARLETCLYMCVEVLYIRLR